MQEVFRPKLYTTIGKHARSPRLSRTIVRPSSLAMACVMAVSINRAIDSVNPPYLIYLEEAGRSQLHIEHDRQIHREEHIESYNVM